MPLNVNLKPADTSTTNNTFLRWFSTYGKYLLVLFNIILFIAYTYKTALIRKKVLLKEEINKLERDIETLSPLANEYNEIQKRAVLVKEDQKEDTKPEFLLEFLKTGTPQGIIIQNISAERGNITLTAISKSPEIFSSLVSAMINEKRFTEVILFSSEKVQDKEKKEQYISKFKIRYN